VVERQATQAFFLPCVHQKRTSTMTDTSKNSPPLIVACPCCRKSLVYGADNRWRPFCSERCRLIDLGEWAAEGHRIAGDPVEQDPPDEE